MKLENGTYALTGVEPFSREENYNVIEGIRLILNGCVYEAYLDPYDGYRSYGVMLRVNVPSDKIRFTFPPQMIDIRIKNEEQRDNESMPHDYWGCSIFDSKNGKLVLKVGTDYYDYYYPLGNYEYYPENLSINKGR